MIRKILAVCSSSCRVASSAVMSMAAGLIAASAPEIPQQPGSPRRSVDLAVVCWVGYVLGCCRCFGDAPPWFPPGGVLAFWAAIALDLGAASPIPLGAAPSYQVAVRVEQNKPLRTDFDRFQIAGGEHAIDRRARDVGDLREL
jgi:hypothetical protein